MPGKLGNDDLQGDVRDDIVKADADLVCMSFNATIIKWLVEWNFPGAALPQVWRKCEDDEDTNQLAERDSKVAKMGFKPTLKYIHEAYGGEWVEAPLGKSELPATPSLTSPDKGRPGGVSFAEAESSSARDNLDDLVDFALAEWQADLSPAANAIQALMDESAAQGETAEQFLARLPGLLKAGGPLALDGKLTQASFVARLAGEAGIQSADDGR